MSEQGQTLSNEEKTRMITAAMDQAFAEITENDLNELGKISAIFMEKAKGLPGGFAYPYQPHIEFLLLFANKVLMENKLLKDKCNQLALDVMEVYLGKINFRRQL